MAFDITLEDQLRYAFEEQCPDPFWIFALNEDACSGVEVLPSQFETKAEFIKQYNIITKPTLFAGCLTEPWVEEVDIYYQDGEFCTTYGTGGCVVKDDAVFLDTYFGVEYG